MPKVVVGVLVYNDKNEIFLAKSNKWSDEWVVPGGHLEWGESFEECAKRETKEETNLELTDLEFIGIQESILPKKYTKKKHMVFVDYCGKFKKGSVKLNDELQEHVWIKPEDSLKLDLNSSTKDFILRFVEYKADNSIKK